MLLRAYDKGIIPDVEASFSIAACAIDSDFFQHLNTIPPEVVQQLRDFAENAPAHPEDSHFLLGIICVRPGFDFDIAKQIEREKHYWAARRLREHFFPDRPLPEFEPLIRLGFVDDVTEVDGSIVVFGESVPMLRVRRHPVHLVAPDGQELVTSTAGMLKVMRKSDRNSADPIVKRRWRRIGLSLENCPLSPDDIPLKPAVWLDRTSVADIPEPPSR